MRTRASSPVVAVCLCGLLPLLASSCTEGDTFVSVTEPSDGRGDPPPPGIDTDGDGLTDLEEFNGWNIAVDDVGFGPGATSDQLSIRSVWSDRNLADTDGDGLSDAEEFRFKTDPRSRDTDSDLIGDRDELFRWRSSPVSVDSDGDARGPDPGNPLPPNPLLFDGSECEFLHTSPTLVDTDADGRTDYEEADHPLRSPLLSELPQVSVDFEGEVDIRLFVEFEETAGTETSFETTVSTTNSTSSSTSTAVTTGGNNGEGGLLGKAVSGGLSGGLGGAVTAFVGGAGSLRSVQNLCDVYAGSSFNTFADGLDANFAQFHTQYPASALVTQSSIFGQLNNIDGLVDDACAGPPPPPVTTTTVASTSSSDTRTYRELLTELQSKTQTASRGQVKVGARVRNDGVMAFRLTDLFVTMSQWQSNPGPNAGLGGLLGSGGFRTLATLRPVVQDVVLAPGDRTQVIELLADEVNPEIIKGFLAHPGSLYYAPAGFELLDVENINFDFLTEETVGRTASVTIDFGGGRQERYVVATNVGRHSLADQLACEADPECDGVLEGGLAGVRMGELFDLIGVPYTTTLVTRDGPTGPVEVRVLDAIDGFENVYPVVLADGPDRETGEPGAPTAFWTIHLWSDDQARVDLDFEDIVVEHGQSIRFVYLEDRDGDGLYRHEEDSEGTLDRGDDELDNETWAPGPDGIPDSVDTDRDGLTDFQELKLGWRVCFELESYPHELPGPGERIGLEDDCVDGDGVRCYPADEPPPCYWVYSDPRTPDTDGDGLTDAEERALASPSDPNNPDTDLDVVRDDLDAFPTTPAVILYVDATAPPGGTGTSWDTAFDDLSDALDEAVLRNPDPHTPDPDDPGADDVSQIWVAAGVYTPRSALESFEVPPGVSLYGGFRGGETRRGQRDPNPVTNGTILSGDLLGNDAAASPADPFANSGDNCLTVAAILGPDGGDPRAFVSIVDGFTITGGSNPGEGGGMIVREALPVLRNLYFRLNQAQRGGGLLVSARGSPGVAELGKVRIEACTFETNRAFPTGPARGGGAFVDLQPVEVLDCLFQNNRAETNDDPDDEWDPGIGGGLCFFGDSILLERCQFFANVANWGGGAYVDGGTVSRCVFRENRVTEAFGIRTFGGPGDVVDIAGGSALMTGVTCPVNDALCPPDPAPDETNGRTVVAQCLFVDNVQGQGPVAEVNKRGGLTGNAAGTHVRNCTFVGNEFTATTRVASVENSILWNNDDEYSSIGVMNNSLVGPVRSPHPGIGNIKTDPSFVGEAARNLRLGPDSPCVDAGNGLVDFEPSVPGIQVPALDLDGRRRIADGNGDGVATIDIGAYELPGSEAN